MTVWIGASRRAADGGVRLAVLRAAGFNNVDLAAAAELGLAVARVPAYYPHPVRCTNAPAFIIGCHQTFLQPRADPASRPSCGQCDRRSGTFGS